MWASRIVSVVIAGVVLLSGSRRERDVRCALCVSLVWRLEHNLQCSLWGSCDRGGRGSAHHGLETGPHLGLIVSFQLPPRRLS
jgi:hypothetical protein